MTQIIMNSEEIYSTLNISWFHNNQAGSPKRNFQICPKLSQRRNHQSNYYRQLIKNGGCKDTPTLTWGMRSQVAVSLPHTLCYSSSTCINTLSNLEYHKRRWQRAWLHSPRVKSTEHIDDACNLQWEDWKGVWYEFTGKRGCCGLLRVMQEKVNQSQSRLTVKRNR